MPRKTQNYKLDYFKQGSYYSALSDLRRFVTMDYNMESYVGIIGVGIIQGWNIESITELTIQITPGNGIIDGYFSESPYVVKQRSDMVSGDREVGIINEDGIPEDSLTVSERATYVSVVKMYNPSFNPVGDIENSYVKVVVPYTITLNNNTDTYIYAQRPTNATSYPKLEDYPDPAGNPPNRSDYNTYDEYKVYLDIYNAKIDAIHNYKWYDNQDNHFTSVEFFTSGSYIKSSSKVLLGRVMTRNNEVKKIDVTLVDNLANLQSQIKKVAEEYLTSHKHGGTKPYDPPKIRLETDIRNTSLKSFNESNGRASYNILERDFTNISLGHKHVYSIDSSGNGQTIDIIGSSEIHFHKISEFVVGNQEGNLNYINDHIHTINNVSSSDIWSFNTPFIVYLNGSVFGNQDSSYIHINSDDKTITFDKGISASNSKYSTEFSLTLNNYANGSPEPINYSYEARDVSIYSFMLKMILDYNSKYSNYYDFFEDEDGVSNVGFIESNIANNPFAFFNSDGSLAGLDDLKLQSSSAQTLLKNIDDIFVFTPNAAKNIPITLKEIGYIDEIKVEFLYNTEVSGTLKAENILYVNANKILTGEFIPEVMPFISHVGRINETCMALKYPMVSSDGVRYTVVPAITDVSLDHYHKLLIDKDSFGATTDLMISDDVVFYQSDENNTYYIYHRHGVNENVLSAESAGLLQWINNSGSSITSSEHTHNIMYPVIGNEKTIYSIKEDSSENIFVGTSDGLMIIPKDPAYEFVINGVVLYFYGNDLWTLLETAKLQYEKETGNPLVVTEEIYADQLDEDLLVNDGDSILMSGTAYPDRQTDYIMVKKISSFLLPNLKYSETKDEYEVLPEETIVESQSDGQVVVERDFNGTPIWSIELSDIAIDDGISTLITAAGSNVMVNSFGINKTLYQSWNQLDIPFSVNVIRKVIKDVDGSYWTCTNNGIIISRYNGKQVSFASLPGGNPDVSDILSGEKDAIYCCSISGIFKTIDGGKTWSKINDVIGGFKQIIRDFSLDKTSTYSGHYHNFDVDINGNGFLEASIGSGASHIHTVSNWTVATTLSHTHTMVVTIYAVDNSKAIWKSLDNGATWSMYGLLPDGECGDVFAAFGSLFVSKNDGLYSSKNGSDWDIVSKYKAYSYEWSYDMSKLMIGSNNRLISTSDGATFEDLYVFYGKPSAILVRNNIEEYFGYAFSNISQSFHFKNLTLDTDEISSLVDFERWYSQNGGWNKEALYDIYIDNKRVLSTKYNSDKREQYGYSFSVDVENGVIDFSATTELSSPIDIYDNDISVASSDGFTEGDLIQILSNSSSIYATITGINGNTLTIDSRSSKNIDLPSSVKKIPDLDGQSSILINVYDSILSNSGNLTHDQIEDGLSNYSDGRPYKFNDAYLSNLLQLTQAVRYVYPNINSEFINSVFYDFRYSWNPSDPIYPSIYDYIDIETGDSYNQKTYDSNFTGKLAKSVNKILVGFGPFSGKILIATDIGIFIAKTTVNLEANWFYVNDLPYATYDLIIFNSNTLYAATSNGTYRTEDLQTWTLEESPAISYPSYSFGLRWTNAASTVIGAHDAEFIVDAANNSGTIVSLSGLIYKDLDVNNGIKVTNAGDKDGIYIIKEIQDNGSGYGSQILVTPVFVGSTEIRNGVVITMGTWWSQWDGDINLSNSNLTNTLLVGGDSHISYNDGKGSWIESSFSDISDFIARDFLSLSNGRIFSSATGKNALNQDMYLIKSDDIGKNWSVFKEFSEVNGDVESFGISDFNNTILYVNYTLPNNYIYVNGILDQQDISIFVKGSSIARFSGKILWNENKDGKNIIVVYGNLLSQSISDGLEYEFTVFPAKVNTMIESNINTLFFGTNRGIYYDDNTIISNELIEGSISEAGINGSVQKIDISGSIVSLTRNASANQTKLNILSDIVIRGNELVGKKLYITDTNPVESYDIIENKSLSNGEEVYVIINGLLLNGYVGKKFKIIGSSSRVYVNFSLPVSANQFNGGKLYISSDEYDNLGSYYSILSNSTDYIDIDVALIPITTMVKPSESFSTIENIPLQVGQNVRLIDSTGNLTLWVTLSKSVKENSLRDFTFQIKDSNVSSTIYSNLINSITLDSSDVLGYSSGDLFTIKGTIFEQLGGFSHLKTSLESGHYHDVDMVNDIVSGTIQSFSNNNASYVDINVSNTTNFNIPLVQYSGDLFEDATIIFTNSESFNLRYTSEVVSHTSSSIRVRIKSSSYWDFSAYSDLKISAGWKWEIDATNYGYTSGITYDDFVALTFGVNGTADRGDTQIEIDDTSDIYVGDKIRIQDDTLSYEIKYVDSIIGPTTIQLTSSLGRTFFDKNNPQIKVLRDSFANTHIHQIRNNEVQPLLISDYLNNGYPSEHSHRILPLLSDVSVLLNNNDDIVAFGSSSYVYRSSNNGETWSEVVDLNDFIEGYEEVEGVSTAIINDNKFIVGTTNGNIFSQTNNKYDIISLDNP